MRIPVLLLAAACQIIAFGQNPNTAIFPGSVAADGDLLVANNNATTTLAAAIDAAVTTIPLKSSTAFVTPLAISIDAEILKCTVHVGVNYTCTRAFNGSTAAAHGFGAVVRANYVAWHLNQTNADLKAVENKLNKEALSVVDLGAKGDCITDDTPAIVAAMSTHARVLVPKSPVPGGCYLMSPMVSPPSNSHLVFSQGAVLKPKPGTYGALNGIFQFSGTSNVLLELGGATMDWTGSGYTPGAAGTVTGASCSTGVITYTDAGHGLSTGAYVTVTGALPVGYNVVNLIVTVLSSSQFTVTATCPAAWTSGGTVTAQPAQKYCFIINAGSTNITIEGQGGTCIAPPADGFVLSGNSVNTTVRDLNATNPARNCFSITAAVGALVDGGFCNGAGQSGFDIEPDTDSDFLTGIRVDNVFTKNAALGGATITLVEHDSGGPTDNIIISHHTDNGSALGFVFNGSSSTSQGAVIVEDDVSELPVQNCQRVFDQISPSVSIRLKHPTCINPNAGAGSAPIYTADISIARDTTDPGAAGVGYNVSVERPVFIESRATPHTIKTMFVADAKRDAMQPVSIIDPQAAIGIAAPRPWLQMAGTITDSMGVWTQHVAASGTALGVNAWPVIVDNAGCGNPCIIYLPASEAASPVTFREVQGTRIYVAGSSGEAVLPYAASEGISLAAYSQMTISRAGITTLVPAGTGWQVTQAPVLSTLSIYGSINSGANPMFTALDPTAQGQFVVNFTGQAQFSGVGTRPNCGAVAAVGPPRVVTPGATWYTFGPPDAFQVCEQTSTGVYAWVTI